MPKAYLVVHKMALYNDEWYDDYTLEVGVANPATLFASRAEAESYVLIQTRERLRGSSFDELELNEAQEVGLADAIEKAGTFDPPVAKALQLFLDDRGKPLPANLTDAQLDTILAVSGLKLFHILETEAEEFEIRLAQSVLALTPERPFVSVEFDYDEEHEEDPDYRPAETVEENNDPAVARLNRVTQLFGRRYADGIII